MLIMSTEVTAETTAAAAAAAAAEVSGAAGTVVVAVAVPAAVVTAEADQSAAAGRRSGGAAGEEEEGSSSGGGGEEVEDTTPGVKSRVRSPAGGRRKGKLTWCDIAMQMMSVCSEGERGWTYSDKMRRRSREFGTLERGKNSENLTNGICEPPINERLMVRNALYLCFRGMAGP